MKKTADENGFTLIEVVIALGILAFAILSMMILQTQAIRGNTAADAITTGSNWAADQIEKVITFDYDDDLLDPLGATSSCPPEIGAAKKCYKTTSTDARYTTYWHVEEDTPIPYTKKVQVVVENVTANANEQHKVKFEYIKPDV